MKDWNVVVTVFQEGFRRALRGLRDFGPVERGPYHNVLVMAVDEPAALLERVKQATEASPALYDAIARVAPAQQCFEFHSTEEFLEKAEQVVRAWALQLGGRSFHIRLHRRGPTLDRISPEVERHLDDAILRALQEAGTPGHVSFTDPDAVIVIDTIDDRAGVSLWTRDDIAQHRLLRPD